MPLRKFRGSWWVDIRHEKVRYRKKSPLNTRAGAQMYEFTLRTRLARGEPVYLPSDPRIALTERRPTFEDFANRWFETYVSTNAKPSTQRSYRRLLDAGLIPAFGGLDLAAITNPLIEEFKAERLRAGNSAKTINGYLIVLRRCLVAAYEREYVPKVPRVQWMKESPPSFDFLTSAESGRLLAHATDRRGRPLILCALRTGMRAGELIGLRWEDVNLEKRILTVRRSIVRGFVSSPKTNRIRHVPISVDLEEELRKIRSDQGYVFGYAAERPLSYKAALKLLRRAGKQAGMRRLGLHTLRHTFASQLAAEGIPLLAIQMLLGHSTIEMTQRYAHLAPNFFTGVVNVLSAAERRDMQPPMDGGRPGLAGPTQPAS